MDEMDMVVCSLAALLNCTPQVIANLGLPNSAKSPADGQGEMKDGLLDLIRSNVSSYYQVTSCWPTKRLGSSSRPRKAKGEL